MIGISKAKQPDTPPKSLPSDPFANYGKFVRDYTTDPESLKPGQKARRTYVVGDVHGSLAGLNNFLKEVKFDASQDEVIFAGDLVAKGPESLKVIDKAIELKARCVRGNHDDKVIRWKYYLDSLTQRQKTALDLDSLMRPKRSIPGDLVENSEHHEIAKKMTKAQFKYLASCPLVLTIPKELSARKIPIHVVHAGIDPSNIVTKQQSWVLVNVRNILKDGTPSRKKKKGESWSQLFNEFHSKRVKQGEPDFLMIYGHDAGRSLNKQKWSVGLDTGCVYGRKLSSYVVETEEIKSFKCPDLGLGDDED
ncbi:MAG: Metallo-dependent phosphatase-like protein [Linnemannia gamsii]|nr:MAG: Metallo-dependent phosphatase-like protein [Linnemannia gamsii]